MNHSEADERALDSARRNLVSYGMRMVEDGLATGTSGNLSVRIGDAVVITPSGILYREITAEDVCVVALDGEKMSGRGKVSSEWRMHSGIYKNTNAAAVVHTHSPEVVALSISRKELPAVHYVIAGLGGPIPVVDYVRFGTDGLAEAAIAALERHSAAILQNHGSVTHGTTLQQAYERALLLEWLAKVYRLSLGYGEPRILSAEELAEVEAEIRRRRYGGPALEDGAS
ncbi:MAG: class II aldolase/adducin family protein [Acidimicrobiales bacterium]